ncbi:TauD/TfdA family dioxygenase [Micromonospora sp. NPDC051296]|uniref:TauD/TfdA family dioxygenase n=1 Tax=Micromonospora sp. NPDC051296 TaxID=3155046 RepID=UPI003420C2E4
MNPTGRLPIITGEGGEAESWVAANRDALRSAVAEQGAIMVRGLGIADIAEAAAVSKLLADRLLSEREGFAPRDRYDEGVYSSAMWPPEQPMCMHNEVSYALEVPRLLIFSCLTAPVGGGATAVSDTRAVLAALPQDLVERFARTGWLLTRSFNDLIGVPWSDAFGTADRQEAQAYADRQRIELTWGDEGSLRTRQHRHAVVRHPESGERCWFNQIAFLNEWTMEPAVREYLVAEFGADGLPFNTFFGDGEPLDETIVTAINDAYERHTVREPWQAGDLMLVDNVRMAHSREPYEGDRDVVVAMADPVRLRGA